MTVLGSNDDSRTISLSFFVMEHFDTNIFLFLLSIFLDFFSFEFLFLFLLVTSQSHGMSHDVTS